MGEVFLAEDPTLGRRVALKVMTVDDPDRRRRFVQEARLASSLTHPNIAQIYEISEADGVPFIAMEYVDGEPLSVRLQRARLTPDEVLEVALQVFDALEEAHGRGIVHRDLKPGNIIVNERGRVKLLDFGLATFAAGQAGTQEAATRVDTDPGLILGTVYYMSPEQALGQEVDGRSDIFSAGIVLYELLTGRLPFEAPTVTATLDRLVHATPEPISRLNYGAAPELERIVRKMLEKPPARRYQNVRDALVDLSNLKRDSDSAIGRAPSGRARSRGNRPIDSVAVLPIATLAGDTEVDYLADGLTESLIDALSQLPKIKVMARSTVFRYKGRDVDPQAIGRELGVRAVLLGRLQHVQDQVVVRTELVDAHDGSQVWGGRCQRRRADALTLQEELAEEIAGHLRLKLTRDDRRKLRKRHTHDPRAYEAYLRGRFQLAKRTREGFQRAIECFDQAIAADDRYALAYAGLAELHTLMATAGYVDAPGDAMRRAREAAERAIRLDARLAEAQAALGWVRFRIDWDWPAAEASMLRALELNAGFAPAYHRYALLLSALGRHDAAISRIRHASELDPLSLIIGTAFGRTLHFARQHERAIEQFRRTLDMDPAFAQAHFDLGMAYAEVGRFDEAIAELDEGLGRGGRRSVMLAVLGHICARAGRVDRARELLADLGRRHTAARPTDYEVAMVLGGLGETDEAVEHLLRSCDQRVGLLVFVKVEPLFDPLRRHPRFAELLGRLGLG